MAYDQRSLDDYVDVAERIGEFRERYPDGTLQPYESWRIIQAEGFDKSGEAVHQTFIVYVAAAYRTPDDPRPGIGAAWEVFPGRTPYTRGSELMNAETSAWGRAIIAVGAADAKRGVASKQEVRNRQAEREDGLPVNRDGSLSRSRTTDEEKSAAGVMTDRQQRDHNALERDTLGKGPQGTERLGTAGDDPFYDQVAPEFAPEERHGSSQPQQRQDIYIALSKHGIHKPDVRQQAIERLIRREITAAADMSFNEAVMVLARVRSWDGRTEELLSPLIAERSQTGAGS